MAISGPTPLASAGRAAAHVVAIVLGWSLFVYGWVRVVARPWDAQELWILIVASAIVLPSLTGLWIVHNLALYRRRHRRRESARRECRYDVDWAGHAVDADWPTLQRADRIWIEVDVDAKRFRAIVPVPLPTPVPAPEPFDASAVPVPGDTAETPMPGAAS